MCVIFKRYYENLVRWKVFLVCQNFNVKFCKLWDVGTAEPLEKHSFIG
jgi:hypothetical protein